MKLYKNPLDVLLKVPVIIFLIGLQGLLTALPGAEPVEASGGTLTIEIIAAPNLVVDSNALSPSTYAPKVATVIGKICNTHATDSVENVTAYIGDYMGAGVALGTPGQYPERTDATVGGLLYEGTYAFEHLGGAADAARFLGDLAAGDCVYQYWAFEYPHYAENSGATIPTWGKSVKADDDLSLDFDIWAIGDGGTALVNATHTATMRNEISAMANKIKPNGNPAGQWFNTDTSTVNVGETIITNGILYRLGNINKGFDNDNDGVPDYNAWVQPFGDPSYDPSCFRLVGVTGVLTVTRSAGNPDMIIPFENNLYFTHLPPDNTDVRGEVFYEFLALGGACTIPVSPYQEVASGSDNEKFNGDYGAGVPGVMSYAPQVTITKIAPGVQAENTTFTYQIPFTNTSATSDLGLVLSSGSGSVTTSLMISDTVPVGLIYVAGSAAAGNSVPSGNSFSIRYSTDGGQTYSTSDPGNQPSTAESEVIIQWWLDNLLEKQGSGKNTGEVTFQATLPTNYVNGGGDPFIENCAKGGLGDGAPFGATCATTLVQGTASIGDRVWQDENSDSSQTGESGISAIKVDLYWDKNGDGKLDDNDVWISTQNSSGTGVSNYDFTQLPAGDYIVKVDTMDADLPTGYSLTTVGTYAVALSAGQDYNAADFGFGPTFRIDKYLTTYNPTYVGEDVVFNIDLYNTRPGDGTANGFCVYDVWAGTATTLASPKDFGTPSNAAGLPNLTYATGDYRTGGNNELTGSNYNSGGQSSHITKLEVLVAIFFDAFLADDGILLTVNGTTGPWQATFTTAQSNAYAPSEAKKGYLMAEIPISAAPGGAWDWGDLAALSLNLEANKNAAGDAAIIYVDAMGFRITTDDTSCATGDSTILTLPLTDTYNASLLRFSYADPAPSDSSTPGTLIWENLGPLYAGGRKTVTVTFEALAATASTSNSAEVTQAKFYSGRGVNDDNDSATVGINASGSISGRVFADTSNPGTWVSGPGYDAGDTSMPGIEVELWGCFSTINGELIRAATAGATNKSCADNANDGEWLLIRALRTGSNGNYTFTGLRDGYYNVKVDTATLTTNFRTNSVETTRVGNGAGASGGDSLWNTELALLNTFNDIVNGGTGEIITSVSFGYISSIGYGVIAGYIWHDVDGDGIWDAGESPISGVDVYICNGSAVSCDSGNDLVTITTDVYGYYVSTQAPGNYRIGVEGTDLIGMSQTGDPDEPGGTCASSCDNELSAQFTLIANESEGPYNFGYQGGLNLSGTVFVDWNGNGGNPETGEEGIASIPVTLYRDVDGDGQIDIGTDTVLSTTVTASDGTYSFSSFPGNGAKYLVAVNGSSIPVGYQQTADYDISGPCSGAACDDDASVTIAATSVTAVDFGYQPQGFGSIGDTIWSDDDGNGEQNGRESGIDGVNVYLYQDQDGDGEIDPEDALADSELTSNGLYIFTNLASGRYIVYVPDSNFDVSTDPLYSLTQTNGNRNNRHQVSLGNSEKYVEADFGYTSSSIGDLIWSDNDGDGVWLSSEPGIPGVVVELHSDPNNTGDIHGLGVTLLLTTTTGSDGLYLFGGLGQGNYIVKIADSNFLAGGALENHTLTADPNSYNTVDPSELSCLAVGAQECDSINALRGITAPDTIFFFGLQLGQNDMSSDFGYKPQGVIGDKVWIDTDGDGLVGNGENGIPFITVNLCSDAACATVAMSTTTDTDGNYSFGGVPDGTYYIKVDTSDPDWPSGLAQTSIPDGGGADNQADGVVLSAGSVADIGTVNCTGNCDLDVDFGYQLNGSGSISGHVFFDAGNDGGVFDGNTDTLYGEIIVYLENSTGMRLITTTASITTTFGATTYSYIFRNLPDDTYTVAVGASSPQLKGLTLTEPSGSSVRTVIVSSGSDETDEDFGFYAELDFGDLPDGYHTTLSKEGPNHSRGSLILGTVIDAEGDGQPVAYAGATGGGDDGDGTNDDDGVVRDSNDIWTANASVDLLFTVTGGTGRLSGWFDWNNDGTFDQLVDFGLVSGSNQVKTMTVPPSYVSGTPVNARFRLFAPERVPGGTLDFGDYTGSATDGEVEDYYWTFQPTVIEVASFTAGHNQFFGFLAVIFGAASIFGVASWRRRRL